ncbi:helix-turn-helix domain-containing protein [Streptomyces prasinus]|uniref:helix-turn-helix domain-containing protein n=1 Tax=Streptomyces prasinus TaxID=67345 RepID=UPI0033F02D5C
MLETVYRNDHLPAAERYEWFCDLLRREFLPNAVTSEDAHDFRASVRHLDMGTTQICVLEYPSLHSRRTPKLVREQDLDMYWLFFNAHGRQTASSGRREVSLTSGELVLLDIGRPFEAWARPTGSKARTISVALPRESVALPRRTLDRLVTTRLDCGTGTGALLASFLRRLVADTRSYGPHDGVRLGAVLTDLAVATLAHHGEAEDALPVEIRHRALLADIHAFIDRHLGTRQLTPEAIAAAHHISVRHLHRLFRERGTTVGEWIRHRRLERCRQDLLTPACAELTVQAIGARWGFGHASEFSRAFRGAYGVPPGAYRRHAGFEGRPTGTA